LSYGTTTNHVLGLEYVDGDGDDPSHLDRRLRLRSHRRARRLRRDAGDRDRGRRAAAALPEAVRVCVAAFGDVESASEAVSAIIGAGLVPTALEIMDA
jgi:glycolate oxidase